MNRLDVLQDTQQEKVMLMETRRLSQVLGGWGSFPCSVIDLDFLGELGTQPSKVAGRCQQEPQVLGPSHNWALGPGLAVMLTQVCP